MFFLPFCVKETVYYLKNDANILNNLYSSVQQSFTLVCEYIIGTNEYYINNKLFV